ncbi:MAG: uroporphyrinogen decarboxylase family protein [Myxococcales bacterium]|nr:uroporphyrinogen decarboxylase family protein [Myxococcales bacterium]
MSGGEVTSLERVKKALSGAQPDRIPVVLPLTMHGAREVGLPIREYFAKPENVAEGQLRLHRRYGSDALTNFHYAALELEAWGGEALFREDGPANAGAPLVRRLEEVAKLEPPKVADCPCLGRVLEATRMLRQRVGGDVPILGLVVSPFSLPALQLGFERYLQLLCERDDLLPRLLSVNEEYSVEWANAQVAAGVDAIGYYDPVCSATIIPPEMFRGTGQGAAERTLSRIRAPAVTLVGAGRCLPIIDGLARTGTRGLLVGPAEELREVKAATSGKLALLGDLNSVEMRRWDHARVEAEVKRAISAAGPGGGFILCDGSGEVPWQVPEEVLLAIVEAGKRWGRYPLDWIERA